MFWSQRTNKTTADAILRVVRAASSEGLSVPAIAERIQGMAEFDKARSFLVARTEMVAATNEGHMIAFRRALVPRKAWRTVGDERVRDTHAAANGQIVEREENFIVGGVSMRGPGQGGVAREVVNCRCIVLAVFNS